MPLRAAPCIKSIHGLFKMLVAFYRTAAAVLIHSSRAEHFSRGIKKPPLGGFFRIMVARGGLIISRLGPANAPSGCAMYKKHTWLV